MIDINRAILMNRIDLAETDEERKLAQALLFGYDAGELMVLRCTSTGDLRFALAMIH